MFSRNKLEEWYEGKKPEYDISECGMVNTIDFNNIFKFDGIKDFEAITNYGSSNGNIFLIDTLSKIYNCSGENVLVTNGASEALFIVLLALCDHHTQITCQIPYYSELEHFLHKIGCTVKYLKLRPDANFKFDFEKFKKVFNHESKLALLNFPNNPTGSELEDRDYEDIIKYSELFHKIVIFDEATALSSKKTYMERNICHHIDNCICINSMSKAYGIPGIRIGWIVAKKEIIKECQAIKELISICTPQLHQTIALNILRNKNIFISHNHQIVNNNICSFMNELTPSHPFFSLKYIPKNCPCCFVKIPNIIKSYDFCQKIYEDCGVLLTPGECFGIDGYIRLGLGIKTYRFNAAIDIIKDYIIKYFELPAKI